LKRILFLVSLFCLFSIERDLFSQEGLLIDDFEGPITKETVDYGGGKGSSVEVFVEEDIKSSGNRSLKVIYEAVLGGYMWIARGYDLDVKGAGDWLILPEEINWKDFKGISFYVYGEDSKNRVVFDIKDSENEMHRFIFKDDFSGWKKITCDFEDFFVRADWQPENAERNFIIDFPIKSFQFEPLPEGKGTLYLDCVELIRK